jgi:hypothetical protein
VPLLLLLAGCISGVTQVAGTGAVYTTRCSSDMDPTNGEYKARCTPPDCDTHFHSSTVSNVVVAFDPGNRVLGYAERVCLQDLSQASAMFTPAQDDATTTVATPAAKP